MSVAGIVTIVLVVVAIAVIARFLILIGSVLRDVSSSLDTVIGAVAKIPEKTEPIESVLTSINTDLATARGVLEGLLAKKLGAPRARRAVALDEPEPEPEPEPIQDELVPAFVPAPVEPPATNGARVIRWHISE